MKPSFYLLSVAICAAAVLPKTSSADVCGNGLSLPANVWTMFSAPCIPPTGNATVNDQFNNDLGAGAAYDSTWIMFKWNTGTEAYEQLAADSPLEQGVGYWIYSKQAGTLKIDNGEHTTTGPVYKGNCEDYGWAGQPCYKIDLAVPASAGETKWNFVGYPFVRSMDWAEVHVTYSTDSGTNWTDAGTPSVAEASGYISKNGYVFDASGSGYNGFDDTASSPSDNTLMPNKSYWFQSKYVSGTTDIALLIPAPKYHVFVTSQSWNGNLGGLSGAAAKCATAVSGSTILTGSDGPFIPWLSTVSSDVAERISHSGPYHGTDDVVVAYNWIDFTDADILSPISKDENGTSIDANGTSIDANVWTGTLLNGRYAGYDCNGWQAGEASFQGKYGDGGESNYGEWTSFSRIGCAVTYHLYCISTD